MEKLILVEDAVLRDTFWNAAVDLKKQNDELKQRIKRLEEFTNRFLDPDDLGYVVNNYVRDDAREALGRERMEDKL